MISRIEKIVLILFVLLLPSQLGYHFWPDWSLVSGVRVDYLSPTIYFLDLIFGALLLLSAKRLAPTLKKLRLPLFIFFAVIVFNILLSPTLALGFYWGARFVQAVLLAVYVTSSFALVRQVFIKVFPVAVLWVCGLAWWQFYLQKSVGSFWYWFGERTIAVSTPGIAKVGIDGLGLFLRPYSTLPHPNALAGFLLLGVVMIYFLMKPHKQTLIAKISVVAAFATILITFSRSVIFLMITLMVAKIFKANKLMGVLLIPFLFIPLFIPGATESYSQRLMLNRGAFETIKQLPFTGTGVGQHIPFFAKTLSAGEYSNLPFQPVHNLYLLVMVEWGILVGFVCLGVALVMGASMVKQKKWKWGIGIIIILVIGLVDHYWYTLLQNRLLMAIFMGVVAVELGRHVKA